MPRWRKQTPRRRKADAALAQADTAPAQGRCRAGARQTPRRRKADAALAQADAAPAPHLFAPAHAVRAQGTGVPEPAAARWPDPVELRRVADDHPRERRQALSISGGLQ
jgi:hypothetical protein